MGPTDWHTTEPPSLNYRPGIGPTLRLCLALCALVLVPSGLFLGCLDWRSGFAFGVYFVFFGAGVVRRVMQYGCLSERRKDQQVQSMWGRLALILFSFALPLAHWAAVFRFSFAAPPPPDVASAMDAVGCTGMILSAGLNAWAAAQLGEAYDRLVAPKRLITDGPYAHVQHPIYSSYALLFTSFCLLFRSPATAAAVLALCGLFFGQRASIEERILGEEFGGAHERYRRRTKRFIPMVL